MFNIQRNIQKKIAERLFCGRVLLIYGARQVGKTTLVKSLLRQQTKKAVAYFDCEDPSIRAKFTEASVLDLQALLAKLDLIVLDEAQKVQDIGSTLKLLADHLPQLQVIALGSASFDLANKVVEPLTGRKLEFNLYPFSLNELAQNYNRFELHTLLPKFLRFGSYPEIYLTGDAEKFLKLQEITRSYLFKDLFVFQDIRNSDLLQKLLKCLALQIGQEVSYHELGSKLGVNEATIARYIDLLEQAFVIFKLAAFSQNPRREIHKKKKIYFCDLGVRNSLIQNLNDLDLRNDVGYLWENFCLVERKKWLAEKGLTPNQYFWRSYAQREIDYLEETQGQFFAYEFKWNKKKNSKLPKEFAEKYQPADFQIITPENFFAFVLD